MPIRSSQFGFSLVETTLAVGLVSFTMIAILGLIPAGLNLYKDARDYTVKAQIVQSISSDSLLTEYGNLATTYPAKTIYYYNDEGLEITSAESNDAVYSAEIDLGNLEAPGIDRMAGTVVHIIVTNLKSSEAPSTYTVLIPKP